MIFGKSVFVKAIDDKEYKIKNIKINIFLSYLKGRFVAYHGPHSLSVI